MSFICSNVQVFDLFQKSAGLLHKEKQKAISRGKGRKDGLASAEVDTALKRVPVSRYIAVKVGIWAFLMAFIDGHTTLLGLGLLRLFSPDTHHSLPLYRRLSR